MAGAAGAAGAGPSYGRSASELAAVASVERYALHPGGRPQAEEKVGLDERLLSRLQSFTFKKPAREAAAAVVEVEGVAGDVEAPPAGAAAASTPTTKPSKGAAGDDEDDDRPCVICTDPLSEGRVICLPCGHIQHKDCALPWLRQEASCPECRFEITPEMLGGTSRRGRGGGR